MKRNDVFVILLAVMGVCACCAAGTYAPWDTLSEASWIDFPYNEKVLNMYPVNEGGAGIAASYPVAFSPAGGDDKARGMNALQFGHGGETTGRMVSADAAGTFEVLNTGNHNVFADILILVAIDTGSVSTAADMGLSLNLAGEMPYVFEPNGMAVCDAGFGRPSGYYYTTYPDDPHSTDPSGEPVAYAFDKAVISVWAVEGVSQLAPAEALTIEYRIENLSCPVVFSVYGYVGTDPLASIYHTNRAFVDANDSKRNPVSTFAVTIAGDLNRDLQVDLADLALLAGQWLKGV